MTENTENKSNNLSGSFVGQVVRLKSGSPYMTVKEVSGENVRCSWFKDKVVMEHVFHQNQIEAQFCEGVFRLRSGGPSMTMVEYISDGAVSCKCVWFDQNGTICERVFPFDSLLQGHYAEDVMNK